MVRLKNLKNGAIVDVPDEKAERLDAEWAPVVAEKPKQEKPAPKSVKK
jgi:hypothetical protein